MVNKGENWDSGIVSMLPTFLVIFLGAGGGGGNEIAISTMYSCLLFK